MHKTYFNWSSGKDSALALHHLSQNPDYKIEKLVTSINANNNRISMHGLRRTILNEQVQAIGLPFQSIEMPENITMEEYGKIMGDATDLLKKEGYTTAAFGDIFLEDLKEYREKKLKEVGLNAVFPLWKRNTKEVIHEFIELGFKSIVVSINSELLDKSFVGRMIDHNFIDQLPENVDPCGENGEFHTFCFDGPIFSKPVPFEIGEKVYHEYPAPNEDVKTIGFWFCDLIPRNSFENKVC